MRYSISFKIIMKIKFYILSLLIIVTSACDTQKKNNQEVDTITATINQKVASENKIQKLLRTIVGTGEGLLRGVNFGDSITDVKKKENLELFEEEPAHIGYTFDTESFETIDILYQKDSENKVSGIQLDVYMNTDSSNDSLKNAMANFFSVRYGNPTEKEGMSIWNIKPEGQVSVKSVKNKLDRGLEIRFTK
jgi:hypothetical protein